MTAGKPAPFRPQGSPSVPLLAALALLLLALFNLHTLAAGSGGLLQAAAGAPLALAQQVAAPLLLAGAVLALTMQRGKHLVDKPMLQPELATPWH